MKKIIKALAFLSLTGLLAACGSNKKETNSEKEQKITVEEVRSLLDGKTSDQAVAALGEMCTLHYKKTVNATGCFTEDGSQASMVASYGFQNEEYEEEKYTSSYFVDVDWVDLYVATYTVSFYKYGQSGFRMEYGQSYTAMGDAIIQIEGKHVIYVNDNAVVEKETVSRNYTCSEGEYHNDATATLTFNVD